MASEDMASEDMASGVRVEDRGYGLWGVDTTDMTQTDTDRYDL